MSYTWILVEDSEKSVTIAKAFVKSVAEGELILVPFNNTRQVFEKRLCKELGIDDANGLPKKVSCGERVTDFESLKGLIGKQKNQNLVILLDVELKISGETIQNIDSFTITPGKPLSMPCQYWREFLVKPTHHVVVYSADTRSISKVREALGGKDRVGDGNAVPDSGDDSKASRLIDDVMSWLREKNPIPPSTQSVFNLYGRAFGENWDNLKSDGDKHYFGHDILSSEDSKHTREALEWLRLPNTWSKETQFSVKGLFQINNVDKGRQPQKLYPVQADYLKAALSALGVDPNIVKVQCDSICLPIAPGVAFLAALSELIAASGPLTGDDALGKPRESPTELRFDRHVLWRNTHVCRLRLQFVYDEPDAEGEENQGRRVPAKLTEWFPEPDSATRGALQGVKHFLRAHCQSVPAQEWSWLFRAPDTPEPNFGAVCFPTEQNTSCLDVFWAIRGQKRE